MCSSHTRIFPHGRQLLFHLLQNNRLGKYVVTYLMFKIWILKTLGTFIIYLLTLQYFCNEIVKHKDGTPGSQMVAIFVGHITYNTFTWLPNQTMWDLVKRPFITIFDYLFVYYLKDEPP